MKRTLSSHLSTELNNENAIILFSGNSNPVLANEIAEALHIPLSSVTLGSFNDGETQCEINENVRDCDVYIVQSTCTPVNENIMELLILVDALTRSSARRVTAVIPYYGYARQDRRDKSRVPITARLVADMLEVAGVDRVITVHLHSAQIQGFFSIPLDHLYTSNILLSKIKDSGKTYTVVSADAGGVKRSRVFAQLLDNAPLAIIDKRRNGPAEAEAMHIIGDVVGKHCLITEDMIDTGGTLIIAAEALKQAGAKSISVCASHAILSKNAIERLEASAIEKIIVTNSIQQKDALAHTTIFEVVSLAPLLAEAIKNVHNGTSISALFD